MPVALVGIPFDFESTLMPVGEVNRGLDSIGEFSITVVVGIINGDIIP